MGQEWHERGGSRLEIQPPIPLSSSFANIDRQQLLLIFKNGCFKLIMMLTRCSLNELFHFITSIPKSLSEIRMTIKHSGYQTFIMDSVNPPTSVLREKEEFIPIEKLTSLTMILLLMYIECIHSRFKGMVCTFCLFHE